MPWKPRELLTREVKLKELGVEAGFLFFFQEAVRNGLVATEVLMWFYIGEIIGKRGIIGYSV